MKRMRLWLRELSLSQQLLSILFLVISSLTIFIFAFLSPGINEFTSSEMFRTLHEAHIRSELYVSNEALDFPSSFEEKDTRIIQVVYDAEADTFTYYGASEEDLMRDEVKSEIRRNAITTGRELQDFSFLPENASSGVLYTISQMENGDYLISMMSAQAEAQFRSLLVNNIVNANMMVAIALFVILTVWVTTIIYPLNLIKAYITKIKNDEPAELTIDRQDEIGQVADALIDMEAQLQKQNREKQEMIQNISHDLKTPIATIRSYGESIKDGIYPYGTLEKSIDVIIEHADRLDKKVRSLIALNKMDYLLDDCPEGDTLEMYDVIEKALLSLKVIRPDITFERDTERGVRFHGDEDPWRIVVENLVDNALRYATSTIRIELHPGELKVINDGSKIEKDRLEKLFRPYEKGTDGQFGLGLSIVYKIVTTYGYRISAENLADGVCFRIFKELDKKEIRAIQKEKKNKEREKAKELRKMERQEKSEKKNNPS
ncbi:MAG: sensor histidine kinase [Solobacterium sp.]|nr:sensor histidine kinase [Solobacterium sp.]